MYNKLLEIIEKELDLENLKRSSFQIYNLERTFSYKKFSKSAEYCFNQFRKSGISCVKKISLASDGITTYLDFVMPEAWDIEVASLEIVEPRVSSKNLVSHKKEPFCIANRCPPTSKGGLIAEVATEEDMKKKGQDIKGKIVFTRLSHPQKIRQEVIKKRGIGIISSYSNGYSDLPNGTWWINGWGSPGWYHTREDKKIFCFSLTPKKGEYLAKLIRETNVKVKAKVKSRIYNGSVYSITGAIPGEKKEEILFCCLWTKRTLCN